MKIVFFDIDGTLAHGKDVPLSAQKAIHQLRENGSLVFICTGRSYIYAHKNFYRYANGFITSNGRYAQMGCCEVLYDHPLKENEIHEIKQKLDSVHAGYSFFSNEAGYYGGNEKGYEAACMGWDPGFIRKGFDENVKVYNFDVWYEDDQMKKSIEEALKGFIINPHGPFHTADVTIPGVDKGTALRAVAGKLNVSVEDTYAFGDGMNDQCMIEAAGHGIAMGNAVQELKDKAEFVTTDIDDNGVWNGLKHYNLI